MKECGKQAIEVLYWNKTGHCWEYKKISGIYTVLSTYLIFIVEKSQYGKEGRYNRTQQNLSLLMGGEGCWCLSRKPSLWSKWEGGWLPGTAPCISAVLCCYWSSAAESCVMSPQAFSRLCWQAALVVLVPSFLCP